MFHIPCVTKAVNIMRIWFWANWFCIFRPSSGSCIVAGRRSVRAGRRTPTTAAIRAPTPHPSWTAASKHSPPSVPAHAAPPPGSDPRPGPPPQTGASSPDRRGEDTQARWRHSLRMLGHRWGSERSEGRWWTVRAETEKKSRSSEPQRKHRLPNCDGAERWSTNWSTCCWF